MVPLTGANQPQDATSLAPHIGGQLSALRSRIATANTPADLDSLLARHICGDDTDADWPADPPVPAPGQRPDPAALAALGYTTTRSDMDNQAREWMTSGLTRLIQRDPFQADRLSFIHDIRILTGIALAASADRADARGPIEWLRSVLTDPRFQPTDQLHDLARQHAHATLTGQPARLPNTATLTGPVEPAMAHWMLRSGTAVLADPPAEAPLLRQRSLRAALTTDPAGLSVTGAALLLHAATTIIDTSIDQMLVSPAHISAVLRRFPAAMYRWRWDTGGQHPIQWEVSSEREVQDILWIMLRSSFDDLVNEETLPKIGHSSYRADFGLPTAAVLIEVKYAYKAADFKDIEQQVMIDSIAYLRKTDRYRELIVFIYDASDSPEYHETTRRDLMAIDAITEVVIVSRPGMLPRPEPRRRTRPVKASDSLTTQRPSDRQHQF